MIIMKDIKSILFIQLPLLNHAYDYIQGNLEYAPASISGYIKTQIDTKIEIFHLPFVISNYSSDSVISEYVYSLKPDMVAFSCYLWNIERNLHIAQMIKENSPDTIIILGGPEIQLGSIALKHYYEQIDFFVIGEGEWFFKLYLTGKNFHDFVVEENKNKVIIQPPEDIIPAALIYEPYTGNRINTMPDGSMFFELTRGCPYRCSYCLYAKNSRKMREVPFNKLIEAINSKEKNRNLNEIYILSPAFNVTKNFKIKLEQLAGLKHTIRLHSEMRAENVTPEQARLLYRAGFRSLEIGLQTLNTSALMNVGRNSDPEKELKGMHELQKAGIDIKIGLIPGLPGDTCESFIAMIDRLIDSGFHDNLELYPLMILPGTEIRDFAIRDKINYLKKPPYYYNHGWGISFNDLLQITKYVEEKTGYSHITKRLPDFCFNDEGLYCRGVCFNGTISSNWNIKNYIKDIQANIFSFFITTDNTHIIYTCLAHLLNGLPQNELFNIIIYNDNFLEEAKILTIFEHHENDNLLRRINIFHEWKNGLRVKLYQVIDDFSYYNQARESYEWIVPIFRIDNNKTADIDKMNDYDDNLLVSDGTYSRIKKSLRKFADSPESVAFENIDEQKEFYSLIGFEYVQLPFTLSIRKK
jgi:radical SAM superfamily enzyme YgiQ (UPF0313 family)